MVFHSQGSYGDKMQLDSMRKEMSTMKKLSVFAELKTRAEEGTGSTRRFHF